MDILINHFQQYFSLSAEEKEAVTTRFTERKIKRRGILLQQGDVCRHFTFVVEGCFKMYATDQQGREHNLQFADAQEWICDLSSFYSGQPSGVYIEAVEASVVLQIEQKKLLELYSRYHKLDRNFRVITEKKFIELQQRVLQNISSTAEERYLAFRHDYPALAAKLPNTQVASYLGITPEFLSKIRKDLANRK